MFYPLLKITVTAIFLCFFIGFPGCMTPPQYAPSMNSQQIHHQPSCRYATQDTPQPISSATWYNPFGIFGQPTPLQTYAPTAKAVPLPQKPVVNSPPANQTTIQKTIQKNSANPKPISQAAHQITQQSPSQPSPQKSGVPLKRLNSVRSVSKVSPELHKPWNLDEFQSKRTVSETYRLVADVQESNSDQTVPPTVDIERLMALPQKQSQSFSAQISAPTSTLAEKMPVFNMGRDFLKEFRPSNDRKWSQNHAVMQTAEFNGNRVIVHNIRYSKYETAEHYTTQYYDAAFNLDDIRTIDLIMVPFRGTPRLAHVESSFGFADGRHLAMSIEARYEEGEKYDPIGAGLRQFELIYVLADERDMIRLGTDVNKNDVHVYRLKFEPGEIREMFVDALQRANKLAEKPEFYHPLTNSCVTNLITHINKGRPKAIPKEYRTLLPGLMDHYVYDLKLIDTTAKNFQEAKDNAKINWLVEKYGDLEYFSAGIRQNMY